MTHGTLRLIGNAINPVQYDPLPADHFVLIPVQGPQVEVYVQQLDLARGTITRNGAEFGQYRKVLNTVGTAVIDLRFQLVLADRVVDVEKWIVQAPASGR